MPLTVTIHARSDTRPILRPSRVPPVLSIGCKPYAVSDIRTQPVPGGLVLHLELTPITPLSWLAAALFG